MSKFCKYCGAENVDGSAVCASCGQALDGGQPQQAAYQQPQMGYQQPQPQVTNVYTPMPVMETSTVTGVGGWIGWMILCSFLPLIGQIIMLAASSDKSVKNFAKAQLILTAIGVILVILLTVVMGVSLSELANQ